MLRTMPNSRSHSVYFHLLSKTGGNVKKMHEILSKFVPKVMVDSPVKGRPISSLQDSSSGSRDLAWDQKNSGLGLQFENGGKLVMLKEPAYVFRTAIGSVGVNSGLHYWEIIPDLRTEN